MSDYLSMAELITPEHRHLLWKDEIGDEFLLLKYAEVYRYSETHLRVLAWSKLNDFLVVEANNDLWCIDTIDGSQVTKLTDTPDEREIGPSWSPNDTEIVFSMIGGATMVMEVDTTGGICQSVPNSIREIANVGKRKLIVDIDWRR